MGRGYIVDHCIASFNKRQEEKAYWIYVTDMLRAINTNFVKSCGQELHTERFADIIKKPSKKKEKTGDEIAAEIIKKWNLKPKGINDE